VLDEQAVVFVALRPLIPQPETKLERWTEAVHLPLGDCPHRVQIFGRIAAPGLTTLRELLPSIALLIYKNRILPAQTKMRRSEATLEGWRNEPARNHLFFAYGLITSIA
jgi:hypothetical protein